METDPKELTYTELKKAYPQVKKAYPHKDINSKAKFLFKLEELNSEKGPTQPKHNPLDNQGDNKGKAQGEDKGSKDRVHPLVKKYKAENKDFLQVVNVKQPHEVYLITGDRKSKVFKFILFRGQYGATRTLRATRGEGFESFVTSCKAPK